MFDHAHDHASRALRSNLKLKHLQLLVALDQHRHLGRAAQSLALTQPAVSKTLAELERLLEAPLFVRSSRGTEPTAQGLAVVRFARSVLAEFERTRDELAAVGTGATGRVRMGAMVVALPGLLMPAVAHLKASLPHITVQIEEGDLTRLLPRLRSGELDWLVGRLEPGYAAPDLLTETLYTEPMCLVVAPGHALAGQRRVGWPVLARQPWVMPPPWAATRVKLHQLFFKHRLNPPADVIESASFLVTLTALQQRGAVGFWARSVAEHAQAQGWVQVLPVAVPIDLPAVGIIGLRGRAPSPTAQQLLASLRQVAAAPAPAKGLR